jgi:hypothetical protein
LSELGSCQGNALSGAGRMTRAPDRRSDNRGYCDANAGRIAALAQVQLFVSDGAIRRVMSRKLPREVMRALRQQSKSRSAGQWPSP